jgi:hypothetical protein
LVAAVAGTDSHQSVLVMFTTADNLKGNGNGNNGNGASNSISSMSKSTLAGDDVLRTESSGGAALSSASSANDPTLTTDKPDYQPGDTVTFSGVGWMPGDTLTITVHEDPTWSFPDRQFVAVVGADGSFTNRDMIVDTQDLNATFTATAVANPSGRVAQVTFTDSKPNSVTVLPAGQSPNPLFQDLTPATQSRRHSTGVPLRAPLRSQQTRRRPPRGPPRRRAGSSHLPRLQSRALVLPKRRR